MFYLLLFGFLQSHQKDDNTAILVCFIYFSFNVQLLDGFPWIVLLYAVSVCHGDMDDFSAARMILSGIPLEESFLQHRLSILMKEEQKSLGGGRLPVPECYYLMGTADPTGILESDEVCVILYVYCLTFFFIFLYGWNHLTI